MSTPQQRALDALASFSRTAHVEGRMIEGFHRLGESPEDHGYLVKVTLSVSHDAESKSYRAQLNISEERFEGGFASHRHGFGMGSRELLAVTAPRFNRGRMEAIYDQALASLKHDPRPLVDLLREESER